MKRLSSRDIADICGILDGWSGKLTWDALIDAISIRMGRSYTRQALDRHERIKIAFTMRKKSLRYKDGKTETDSPELQKTLERLERLKAENERLNAENTQLLEQYARWAYNAKIKGLSEQYLNQPLPKIDRGRTKIT